MSDHTTHLIQNAKAVVSVASTFVGQTSAGGSVLRERFADEDHVHYGSEFGAPLNTNDRARIQRWIPEIPESSTTTSDSTKSPSYLSRFSTFLGLWTQNPKNTSDTVIGEETQSLKSDNSCDSGDEDYEVAAAEILFTKGAEGMVRGNFSDAEGFFQWGLSKVEKMSSRLQPRFDLQEQRLQLALACFYQGQPDPAITVLQQLSQSIPESEREVCRKL